MAICWDQTLWRPRQPLSQPLTYILCIWHWLDSSQENLMCSKNIPKCYKKTSSKGPDNTTASSASHHLALKKKKTNQMYCQPCLSKVQQKIEWGDLSTHVSKKWRDFFLKFPSGIEDGNLFSPTGPPQGRWNQWGVCLCLCSSSKTRKNNQKGT